MLGVSSRPTTATRAFYLPIREIATRWMDNDALGPGNGVTCDGFFDALVNRWLIDRETRRATPLSPALKAALQPLMTPL